MAVTRSSTATYVIPTENEWYKAAYFDPTLNAGAGGYWLYPTKSNTPPGNALPDTGNNANCNNNNGFSDPVNFLTPVGDFVLSPGPYGTYDMGGDIYQWNEADFFGSDRGYRGGSFVNYYNRTDSSFRSYDDPTDAFSLLGFRVASSEAVPEPSTLALLIASAVGLLAFAWRGHTFPTSFLKG